MIVDPNSNPLERYKSEGPKCLNCGQLLYNCRCSFKKELPKIANIPKVKLRHEITEDSIVNSVIKKLAERSNIGVKKYNTSLKLNTRDNFLEHFQMEMLDGINYIQTLLEQSQDITQICEKFKNDTELGAEIRKIYGN